MTHNQIQEMKHTAYYILVVISCFALVWVAGELSKQPKKVNAIIHHQNLKP
jgi:hypothetical protein